MMALAEIEAHSVHVGKCGDLVATELGLEVPQKTFVFMFTL